jgi:hypothetical protein
MGRRIVLSSLGVRAAVARRSWLAVAADRRRLVDEIGPDEVYGLGPQANSVDWQALPRR